MSIGNRRLSLAGGAALLCLVALRAGPASAQGDVGGMFEGFTGDEQSDAPLEVKADEFTVDYDAGWYEGKGHVRLTRGNQVVTCDTIQYNMKSGDVLATGNVRLQRGAESWTGEEVRGNVNTGHWDVLDVKADASPFKVESESLVREPDGSLTVQGARVTTCTNHPSWHYHVRASKVTLIPREKMKLKNSVVYLGPVPIFWWPYWSRSLKEDTGLYLRPGYNSRMGAYLLASYRYRLNPFWRAETHLDYRTERGVATGQDFKWADPAGRWRGQFEAYFARDDKPIDDDEDLTQDIDENRYRIHARHSATLSPRDTFMGQGYILSDTDVVEDFYPNEYRDMRQPDNYASYVHRWDQHTFELLLRTRLNNFFTQINRLPEARFTSIRQQIGSSPFYYQGSTALGYLLKSFAEFDGVSADEDYSSARFDTAHTFYYPGKYFGFLNVVPRAGIRGTYFSTTKESEVVTSLVTSSTTNTVVSGGVTNTTVVSGSTTNTATQNVDADAALRMIVQLGVETSFKAFKTWQGGVISPLRHIVEPYANYTLTPTPSVEPNELYQFDSVDGLDKQHTVRLGVRNKFQTKHGNRAFDLIDADVHVDVDLDPGDDDRMIEDIDFDVEWTPSRYVQLDLDGKFDLDDTGVSQLNARFTLRRQRYWAVNSDWRFRRDSNNSFGAGVDLYPTPGWWMGAHARHEFEEGRLQQVGGYLQRNLDCLVFKLGLTFDPGYTRSDGTEQDDDYRVFVEAWLTAFPQFGARGRS